jgi:hypothetical protein
MRLYRVFTENKNQPAVERIASKLFEGFTLYNAIGFWKGAKEKSLLLEVVTDKPERVDLLAGRIKRHNNQEVVMVEEIKNSVKFI